MRARIEQNFLTRGHRVWLYEPGEGGGRVLSLGSFGSPPQWVGNEGEIPEPTFELPEGALDAILEASGALVRETAASLEALADTRAQRDRLLHLVEASLLSHLPPPTRVDLGGGQ